MGIIAKQSIKGSIYTYLGAFLGFISTGLLMPKFFDTTEIGLTQILIALTLVFSQIGNLGFTGVITRMFPYFRNEEKKHNGILTLGLIISVIGSLIVLIVFYFSQDYLIESNLEKSPLLSENIYFLPFLIIFTIFSILFDNYSKALFDAVIGTIFKELIVRLLNLTIIILFIFEIINFNAFITFYVVIYTSPAVFLLFVLMKRKQFLLGKINKNILQKHRQEIIKVAGFWILASFSWMAVVSIDKYMVNSYLGLGAVGIYSVTFYFGALVALPARAIRKISSIVLAEAWKKNDKETVFKIYQKSTLNQLIIGSLLFIGLWSNIDNVFQLIPKYSEGKYVVLFIGLANVVEMLAGVCATIISNSKDYRISAYVVIIMLVAIVITNIIFIDLWGLTGAAFASLLSVMLSVFLRFLFLRVKYKFQPYTHKHLLIIIIAMATYGLSLLIPTIDNFYFDILIRGSFVSIIFVALIYFSKVSDDANNILNKYLKKIKH